MSDVTRQQSLSRHRSKVATAVIDLGDFHSSGSAVASEFSSERRGDLRIDSAHSLQRFAGRSLAGQPLVLRMAARLSECQWVDRIFAVGCGVPEKLKRIESPIFELIDLPSCHLVERVAAVLDRTESECVVYVPSNRPFVDAGLIDGLISKASRQDRLDYLAYASSKTGQHRLMHLGLDGELCHRETIRRLLRNSDRIPACPSLFDCIEKAPGSYERQFLSLPAALDHCELRFAIENEDDWDDAQIICESLAEVDVDWQQVAGLIGRSDESTDMAVMDK